MVTEVLHEPLWRLRELIRTDTSHRMLTILNTQQLTGLLCSLIEIQAFSSHTWCGGVSPVFFKSTDVNFTSPLLGSRTPNWIVKRGCSVVGGLPCGTLRTRMNGKHWSLPLHLTRTSHHIWFSGGICPRYQPLQVLETALGINSLKILFFSKTE